MSKAQSTAFEKVRARGGGDQGVSLADGSVRALVALVARDLALPPVDRVDVTIAASGQGRWPAELAYPADCEASGYAPVLVVFDGTDNPKLSELRDAFISHGGQAYIGEEAWAHLESEAGPTMGLFVDKYIRGPLDDLLAQTPTDLPEVSLLLQEDSIHIRVGTENSQVYRT